MKAIVYHNYGSPDVLKCEEVEKPAVGDNQVLIKVHAASLNALDWHLLSADIFLLRLMGGGLFKPKDPRLGHDLAGRIEAVGSKVTQFQPGDEVFGAAVGAFAEYACAPETALVLKPPTMTFETAAALPVAALTALQGLRDHGQIQPGQKVLIQGASGGVGTFAVQIAKAFGAEVTAVCSTRNLDLVRSIGADHVMDYTREDFTRQGQRYDLILAVNGYHPILAYRRALSPTGRYVLVGASSQHLLRALFQTMVLGSLISRVGRQEMGFMGEAKMKQEDLVFVRELIEAGKVVPVLDGCYPLSETAEAFRYFAEVHPKGKVVILTGRPQAGHPLANARPETHR
jgi:NADPH:quinone reductase-like Zn-dependent oxidoreductase